jgi:UDP-glucose 4-epimerase
LDRVIITGGNGFIGRHLVKKLLSYKPTSVILISKTSKFHYKYFEDKELARELPLTFYSADIRDRKAISNIFRKERADTCIHLAAKISAADSIRNPEETMDINAKGTLNVLEACDISKVSNFVFASSAAVYGNLRELPIQESCKLQPLTPYGTSKMVAEQHVSSYSKLKKIQNAVTLRIFNVYGNGQANEGDMITNFATRLSRGLAPAIYGDGTRTRDFISVDDVTDAFLLSIRTMEEAKNNNYKLTSPLVFNIGTGIPTSINELAQKMIEIFGLDLHPCYEGRREDERVILHSYADMTKAKEILHFVPKKDIDEGLREIIGTTLVRK